MRPFLALDTATDHVALGVGDLDAPDAVVAATAFRAPRAANTVVLLEAERLLASVGLAPTQLAAVACGRGPGSFTGVRIAVATAKGVAHGAGLPLVGFGTPDAVATRGGRDGLFGVVIDAMRAEVYPSLFRVEGPTVRRISADRVAFPADVAAEWAALDEPLALSGSGLAKHRDVFVAAMAGADVVDERLWAPDGASLVKAAWATAGPESLSAIAEMARADAFAVAHPARLLPVYTRLSDAEEAERAAARRGGPTEGGVAGPEGAL